MKTRLKSMHDVVQPTVSDTVGRFLYYDRKEDEALPEGGIEDLIAAGLLTIDELVEMFAAELRAGLS